MANTQNKSNEAEEVINKKKQYFSPELRKSVEAVDPTKATEAVEKLKAEEKESE